ncbi:hypothetical protein SAMN05444274_103175 [Mariniphaga anaerophila]|uniref:DUF2269 family protein n=1 Tax=Mariniphaga anaerophila TaxID=1484053 RepID=A0A1M4XZ88_9BACT|nr:hypothetical protein [Mariniphaga anaerophila]SHE98811.1 hypothetical protein SAMN05444274_103175 [Mariniphaga anaerophila]
MEKHVNIVAALHIGLSILGILAGIFVYVLFYFIGDLSNDDQARFVLSIIAKVLVIFMIVLSLPGIVGGIGLFKRKEWARILTLIVSVLDLVNFPVGTAVGVYSIWALAQPEIIEQFKQN